MQIKNLIESSQSEVSASLKGCFDRIERQGENFISNQITFKRLLENGKAYNSIIKLLEEIYKYESPNAFKWIPHIEDYCTRLEKMIKEMEGKRHLQYTHASLSLQESTSGEYMGNLLARSHIVLFFYDIQKYFLTDQEARAGITKSDQDFVNVLKDMLEGGWQLDEINVSSFWNEFKLPHKNRDACYRKAFYIAVRQTSMNVIRVLLPELNPNDGKDILHQAIQSFISEDLTDENIRNGGKLVEIALRAKLYVDLIEGDLHLPGVEGLSMYIKELCREKVSSALKFHNDLYHIKIKQNFLRDLELSGLIITQTQLDWETNLFGFLQEMHSAEKLGLNEFIPDMKAHCRQHVFILFEKLEESCGIEYRVTLPDEADPTDKYIEYLKKRAKVFNHLCDFKKKVRAGVPIDDIQKAWKGKHWKIKKVDLFKSRFMPPGQLSVSDRQELLRFGRDPAVDSVMGSYEEKGTSVDLLRLKSRIEELKKDATYFKSEFPLKNFFEKIKEMDQENIFTTFKRLEKMSSEMQYYCTRKETLPDQKKALQAFILFFAGYKASIAQGLEADYVKLGENLLKQKHVFGPMLDAEKEHFQQLYSTLEKLHPIEQDNALKQFIPDLKPYCERLFSKIEEIESHMLIQYERAELGKETTEVLRMRGKILLYLGEIAKYHMQERLGKVLEVIDEMHEKGWKIVETENIFSFLNKLSVPFQTFSSSYSTELFEMAVREGDLEAANDLSSHVEPDAWNKVFWDACFNLDLDMVAFLLTNHNTNPYLDDNYQKNLALFTSSKNTSVEEEGKRKKILDQLKIHERTPRTPSFGKTEKALAQLSLAPAPDVVAAHSSSRTSTGDILRELERSSYPTGPLLNLYGAMRGEEEAVEEVKKDTEKEIKSKQKKPIKR